jgi:hypothetical protein
MLPTSSMPQHQDYYVTAEYLGRPMQPWNAVVPLAEMSRPMQFSLTSRPSDFGTSTFMASIGFPWTDLDRLIPSNLHQAIVVGA